MKSYQKEDHRDNCDEFTILFCCVMVCKINKFINWISYFILVHQTCRLSLAGTHHPVAILPTEMGLVGRIGKTLGLKADCTSCRESGSMGTFKAPEPVSCVELDAIFSGIYFHRSPAVGLYAGGCKAQLSTFSLVQYIAMVISCAIHNLCMFLINSFTKSMGSTEIHRSTFYLQYLSGRNGYFIDGYIKSALMVTILFKTVGEGLAIPARLKKP